MTITLDQIIKSSTNIGVKPNSKPTIILLYEALTGAEGILTARETLEHLLYTCERQNLAPLTLITAQNEFDFTALETLINFPYLSDVVGKNNTPIAVIVEQNILAASSYSAVWAVLGALSLAKLIKIYVYNPQLNELKLLEEDLLKDSFDKFKEIIGYINNVIKN